VSTSFQGIEGVNLMCYQCWFDTVMEEIENGHLTHVKPRLINWLANRPITYEGRLPPSLLVAFVLIGILAAVDLIADAGEGTKFRHLLAEGAVALIALTGAMIVIRHLIREAKEARNEAKDLGRRLEGSRQEVTQWREEAQSLLRGLGVEIDRQFGKWNLTSAEKEVALFLLKGLSHKEVAQIRHVSEATTRQQARTIYRKAGVAGRHDLAAFFLEDLALPPSSD
jgi:DNA-binding NarL/FixJ family response regulator